VEELSEEESSIVVFSELVSVSGLQHQNKLLSQVKRDIFVAEWYGLDVFGGVGR
jgi:hypothetical protein